MYATGTAGSYLWSANASFFICSRLLWILFISFFRLSCSTKMTTSSSSSTTTGSNITATNRPRHCYIDIDINSQRSKLAFVAAFVDATNTRYGLTSKDIRKLGGSEISRLLEFIQTDHEWSSKAIEANVKDTSDIKPPAYGSRMILELFWDVAPLACENFSKLCCHQYATRTSSSTSTTKAPKLQPIPIGECGKPLTYRGSNIHRVVPGFIMQGGDFVFGNGSGGESIFGTSSKGFKDERAGLLLRHDRRGILSMGNSGKHSNTSQFFLTFGPVPQCDTKHVVFGQIRSGFDVLRAVELVGNTTTRSTDERPLVSVQITDCGIYEPQLTPGAGYWLDLPDLQSFTGSTPIFLCRPRVVLIVPADEVALKCQQVLSTYATCIAIIIVRTTADSAYGTLTYCHNNVSDQPPTTTTVHIPECIETMWKESMADVFIVVPACAKSVTELIQLDTTTTTRKDDVILISKPSDCLVALRNKSWISRMGWALDGAAVP